jgi:hypothetical protein
MMSPEKLNQLEIFRDSLVHTFLYSLIYTF